MHARAAGHSLSDEAKSLLRKGLLNDADVERPAGKTAFDAMRLAFSGAYLSSDRLTLVNPFEK